MIKKKNILRVSVLCMALLFGGQAFAKDVSAEQVIEELTEELDSPDPDGGHYREAREQSSPRRARMRMKASSTRGWYGSQLASGNEQAFYDALLEKSGQLSEMTAAYAAYKQKTGSVDGTFVSITLSDPVTCVWAERYQNADYLELYMAFNRATHAFIKDYPEYFWLGSFTIGFHAAKNSDGTHTLKGIKLSPAEYYEGLMTDDFGITAEALQAAIAAVGSQDTAYDTVKAAHDYTVNLINYGNAGQGYGHVITGALLQKYEHTAVCEAYAKLFCLLCRENGINCITINGGAKRDSNGNIVADHMWNYVQIDGFWYLVDATWDDTLTTKAYFLAGAESAAYSSTKTVSDNHMPVGIFSTDDSQAEYAAFSVPAWSELSYEERNTVLTPEKDRLTLKVGETGDLSSVDSTFHESTTRVTCSYESSDKKVVTVDSKGKVTAAGVGTAEITITSSVLSKVKTTVSVTVEAAVPETEPATEPVTNSETEPVTEPVTDPETEPAADPVTESVTEPVTNPETEPATEPVTDPATEPSTEPVTDPATEPATEPVTEPATEPSTEPVTDPATEPATEPVTNPATDPATEPVTNPETEPATKPSTEKVTEKATEKVTEKATEKVTEKATEKVTEKTTEKVTEKASEKTTEKPVDKGSSKGSTGTTKNTGSAAESNSAKNGGNTGAKSSSGSTANGGGAKSNGGSTTNGGSAKSSSGPATNGGSTKGDSGSTTNGSSSKSDSGSATNDSSAKDTGATASETEKKDPAGQQSTEISNAYARFSVSSLPLQIGKKSDALTQALSYAAGDRIISWSSNKPKVVEVNKITGQIRAKKKGSAVITVTLASGKTASCKIKTQKKPVKTKKLSVESKNLQLGKGSRYQLTVARTPLTASDKLTFTSSNKKVIKVNGKGQLKALKKGSAKITVRSANGKKLVIKVKVK